MSSLRYINNISIRDDTLKSVETMLKYPYENGGVKRVHIGETAVKVENKNISQRCKAMKEAGYGLDDYFIEFNSNILPQVEETLRNRYNLSYTHCCTVIIPPGQCMPAHSDTYSYLMRYMTKDFNSVTYDLKQDVRRYLVFLKDWQAGQALGAENTIKCGWKIGGVYEWDYKAVHWCSNSSLLPTVFFEITGLNLEKK